MQNNLQKHLKNNNNKQKKTILANMSEIKNFTLYLSYITSNYPISFLFYEYFTSLKKRLKCV